ncbi:MAG: hypothetical protein V4451_20440 [Pseudomonadota bacterium]
MSTGRHLPGGASACAQTQHACLQAAPGLSQCLFTQGDECLPRFHCGHPIRCVHLLPVHCAIADVLLTVAWFAGGCTATSCTAFSQTLNARTRAVIAVTGQSVITVQLGSKKGGDTSLSFFVTSLLATVTETAGRTRLAMRKTRSVQARTGTRCKTESQPCGRWDVRFHNKASYITPYILNTLFVMHYEFDRPRRSKFQHQKTENGPKKAIFEHHFGLQPFRYEREQLLI